MSSDIKAFNNALLVQLRAVSNAACDVVQRSGGLQVPLAKIVDAFDELFVLCSDFVVAPENLVDSSWSHYVRTARVLDRALALAAALDAELYRSIGLSPFRGLLTDGEGLAAVIDRRLVGRCHSSEGRLKLYFSPGLIAAADAGSIRYVVPDEVPQEACRALLAGAAGDVLDLLTELRRESGVQQPSLVATMAAWERGCRPFGVMPRVRKDWQCGELLEIGAFADQIDLETSEVENAVAKGEILSLTLWDGSVVYPSIQIDQATGKVYEYLPQLLSVVTKEWSQWHLALWLGTLDLTDQDEDGDGGKDKDNHLILAEYLRTADGLEQVKAFLDEFEKLDVRRVTTKFQTPTSKKIKEAYDKPLRKYLPSSPDMLRYDVESRDDRDGGGQPALSWSEANGDDLVGRVFRITRSGHGPFFYGHARVDGSGGRFDLTIEGRGTCYLSFDPVGAMAEVFGRVPILSMQEIASRSLWEMIPVDRHGPFLDLSDNDVSKILPHGINLFGSTHRSTTQKFASRVAEAGYLGIVHELRHYASSNGLAIFGPAGRHGGEGRWHMLSSSLIAEPMFWDWLKGLDEADYNFFPAQLPSDRPRP